MPIKSYLAQPHTGRHRELLDNLQKIPACEVIPSSNKEVVIIVTDTADKAADEALHEQLSGLDSIKMLSLVSGFYEE